jgi:tRNA(fMet)-specific endonuclease VapC
MIAFDTDVLVEIFLGNQSIVQRAAGIPPEHQGLPIVVIEEVLRGRLNAIRQAEGGKGRITIVRAYQLFEESLDDFRHLVVLPYNAQAETLFRQWREKKVRVSTHDLRIAAVCVAQQATLVSRNRRHFERVPGLSVEFWD